MCLANQPGRWGGVIRLPNENNVTAAVTPSLCVKSAVQNLSLGQTVTNTTTGPKKPSQMNDPVIIHFIWSCLILQKGYKENKLKRKINIVIVSPPPTPTPIPPVSQYCISGRRSPKGHWHGGDLSYYYQLATALHNFGSGWSPASIIPQETINRKPCWESHWILCKLPCQSIQLERLQASPILLEKNPPHPSKSIPTDSLIVQALSLSHTHTHTEAHADMMITD